MIRYQHLPGRYTPNSRYSTHSSQSPNVNKRNLHHLPTISLFPIHSKIYWQSCLFFLSLLPHFNPLQMGFWPHRINETALLKVINDSHFFFKSMAQLLWPHFFFFNYPSASFDPIDYFLLKTLFSKYHRSYLTDYSFSEASFPSPNF